ncbi:unnamed protein product [Rotaria magnacalcarata]|uniref:Uncharacterized protein n=2 Tax=Rotaria magnacalcarata TaxID=392030 RepID=A0A816NMF5_9BILA|nr:unnamed protein product [Rotaria magnacalcarata]CAF1933939.1 unnamed protein product [Rotaria magnacalcarata]CAF2036805.1 unnamed protein product [Rotaria magnacalcarata]
MAVLTEDQKGLEVSIKMLEEACKAYGMKVNAKKTKILHIDDAQTDQLWQVNLTLIGNGNHDSNMFTSYLRHQLIPFNGWSRLGLIFIQVGESSKAEYLYKILLDKASSDKEQVEYHHQLEIVYNSMGEYLKALSSYQRSIEMYGEGLPMSNPSLATSYNNIGLVHNNMSDYSRGLSAYKCSLRIIPT